MKRFILGAAIASGLITFGVPGYSQDRDDYYNQNRDEAYWRGRLFDRVREDLDHIQARTPVFSGDEFRLGRAKQELGELQRDAAAGRFIDRDLDDVINSLEKVASDNRMPERDRGLLNDDLNRLREYREHHERYYPKG